MYFLYYNTNYAGKGGIVRTGTVQAVRCRLAKTDFGIVDLSWFAVSFGLLLSRSFVEMNAEEC